MIVRLTQEDIEYVEDNIGTYIDIYTLDEFSRNKTKEKEISVPHGSFSPSSVKSGDLKSLLKYITEIEKEEILYDSDGIKSDDEIKDKLRKRIVCLGKYYKKIIKKKCNRLITTISYPLGRHDNFKKEYHFEIILEDEIKLNVHQLHLIHSLVYNMIYDMNDRTSRHYKSKKEYEKNPKKYDGMYGIWGHDIGDLIYNGNFKYRHVNANTLWFHLDVDS